VAFEKRCNAQAARLRSRQQRGAERVSRTAQSHLGFALKVAQSGGKHLDAKPLKGFGGASVIEIVENYDGDTYRAVYTVKFSEAIYVLHAFQKKSKSGIATSKKDLDLIEERLKRAKQLHALRVHDKSKARSYE
jgi:phage-related protein